LTSASPEALFDSKSYRRSCEKEVEPTCGERSLASATLDNSVVRGRRVEDVQKYVPERSNVPSQTDSHPHERRGYHLRHHHLDAHTGPKHSGPESDSECQEPCHRVEGSKGQDMFKLSKTEHHKEAEGSDGWYEMEEAPGLGTAEDKAQRSELPLARASSLQRPPDELAVLSKYASSKALLAQQKKQTNLEHMIFHITVVSGEQIPRKDVGWAIAGSCDPYVKITFASNTFKTFVARNTLNPQWEEGLGSRVFRV
jgi:hypothetical protein